MTWKDVDGGKLVKVNLKKYDFDKLGKSVKTNGSLTHVDTANGTILVSSKNDGKKDDQGRMHDDEYRLDIQSVNGGYVNWQLQKKSVSYACILTKCDVYYSWDAMVTEIQVSAKGGKMRKDF
jgi:hypothetical protein